MDIPQLGIHIPEWVVWLSVAAGLFWSTYQSNKAVKSVRVDSTAKFEATQKQTKELTSTVQDNTATLSKVVADQLAFFKEEGTRNNEMWGRLLDNKENDIREMRGTITLLEKDLMEFKELTKTQGENNAKQAATSASAIKSLEARLFTVSKELEANKAQYEKDMKRLSEQLADSQQLVTSKDTELEARGREILELTQKLQDYQALELQVSTLRADVDQLKKDIEDMNEEKAKLLQQVTDLQVELDRERALRLQAEKERDEARTALQEEKKKATGSLPPLDIPAPQHIPKRDTGKLPELPSAPAAGVETK